MVLNLATSNGWSIHQLDVKNTFLHGNLSKAIFCQQPFGFVDSSFPNHVCRFNKSLYGLKQAPRTWFRRFADFVFPLGFCNSTLIALFSFTNMAMTQHTSSYMWMILSSQPAPQNFLCVSCLLYAMNLLCLT